MKTNYNFPLEVSIHPITLEFSDAGLEQEYRKCYLRLFRHVVQVCLALLITIMGSYYSLFPQNGIIHMLIYIGALFMFVWGITHILERRQRIAFLSRKNTELRKAHITQALRRIA